jgi:hypothetical protein
MVSSGQLVKPALNVRPEQEAPAESAIEQHQGRIEVICREANFVDVPRERGDGNHSKDTSINVTRRSRWCGENAIHTREYARTGVKVQVDFSTRRRVFQHVVAFFNTSSRFSTFVGFFDIAGGRSGPYPGTVRKG